MTDRRQDPFSFSSESEEEEEEQELPEYEESEEEDIITAFKHKETPSKSTPSLKSMTPSKGQSSKPPTDIIREPLHETSQARLNALVTIPWNEISLHPPSGSILPKVRNFETNRNLWKIYDIEGYPEFIVKRAAFPQKIKIIKRDGGNQLAVLPPTLMDAAIESRLTSLRKTTAIQFMNMPDVFVSKTGDYLAVVEERVSDSEDKTISYLYEAIHVLFQLIYALSVAKNFISLTIYNLSPSNLAFVEDTHWIKYPIKNGLYLKSDFIIKLIDLSIARFEYQNTTYATQGVMIHPYPGFHPSIDLLSFMSEILRSDIETSKLSSQLREYYYTPINGRSFIDLFMEKAFGIQNRSGNWSELYQQFGDELLLNENIIGIPLPELLEWLSDIMINLRDNRATMNRPEGGSEVLELSLTKTAFLGYTLQSFDEDTWGDIFPGVRVNSMTIRYRPDYSQPNVFSTKRPPKLQCPVFQLSYDIVIIDINKLDQGKWKMDVECCTINPIERLRKHGSQGLVLPIGPTDSVLDPVGYVKTLGHIDTNWGTNELLSSYYSRYYGHLVILDGNRPKITYKLSQEDTAGNSRVTNPGPLLVSEGKVAIGEEFYKQFYPGTNILPFICADKIGQERTIPLQVAQVDGRGCPLSDQNGIPVNLEQQPAVSQMMNCLNLKPGEIGDMNALIPRAMFLTRTIKNRRELVYVIINDSVPINLPTLARLAIDRFHADNAVAVQIPIPFIVWRERRDENLITYYPNYPKTQGLILTVTPK